MDTEKRTNSHQELSKWSPKHSKIEAKTVQNRGAARDIFGKREVRTAKNSDKNIDPGKKRGRHHSVHPFWPKKLPTWRQVGFQNRAKINKRSLQESIKKLMPFTIDFQINFGGFSERKWKHVGTKIDEKSIRIAKNEFLINRALAAAGAWSVRFWGPKLGAKTHQKTIKKWSQHEKASWHRFFLDFGEFWKASWEAISSQDRCKKASKKRCKKERQQDSEKGVKSASHPVRHHGSEALGRRPPLRRDSPLGPPPMSDFPFLSSKVF